MDKTYLKEKVLFILDKDIVGRDFICAISAIQKFIIDANSKNISWNKVYRDNRVLDLTLYIAIYDPYFCWLIQTLLPTVVVVAANLEFFGLEDWDYVVNMSCARAKLIAAAGNLHISQAYGIMLGSDPKSFPDLSLAIDNTAYNSNTVLVCAPSDFNFGEYLDLAKVTSITCYPPYLPTASLFKQISSNELVFGFSCLTTYVASCLKKPVVEFITRAELSLYSQWSNPNYLPIILDEGPVDVERVKVAVDRLLKTYRTEGMKKLFDKSVVEK